MTDLEGQSPRSPWYVLNGLRELPPQAIRPESQLAAEGHLRRKTPIMLSLAVLAITVVTFGMVYLAGKSRVAPQPSRPASGSASELSNTGGQASFQVEQAVRLPHPLPIALALMADDTPVVACEDELLLLTPEGTLAKRVPLKRPPQSLAVAPADHPLAHHVFLATQNTVAVFNPDFLMVDEWTVPGPAVHLVAIAVGKDRIYVLNAALGQVLQLSLKGEIVREFAGRDPQRNWPGLILPSLQADLAVDTLGRVFVTNPGLRRIEVYNPEGQLEVYWGEEGPSIEAFFGCCNPQNIALFPDGNLVTTEKGILRVKAFSPYGEFLELIAGPEELAILEQARAVQGRWGEPVVPDVAVDGQNRVWVLGKGLPILLVLSRSAPPPDVRDE